MSCGFSVCQMNAFRKTHHPEWSTPLERRHGDLMRMVSDMDEIWHLGAAGLLHMTPPSEQMDDTASVTSLPLHRTTQGVRIRNDSRCRRKGRGSCYRIPLARSAHNKVHTSFYRLDIACSPGRRGTDPPTLCGSSEERDPSHPFFFDTERPSEAAVAQGLMTHRPGIASEPSSDSKEGGVDNDFALDDVALLYADIG